MTELRELLEMLPPWFWIGYFVIVGSFVGSFMNVVVYRLPRNCLSINNPKRSFCPSCKTQLKWNDNLPVLGWVILRGKCRYCEAKYGVKYPLIEALVAGLFGFSAWLVFYSDGLNVANWQAWLVLLHILAIIGVLLSWALIDLDLTYIPDKLTLGPLIVFIPFAAFSPALEYGLTNDLTHLLFDFSPIWLNSMLSALLTGLCAALTLWLIGKFANVVFRARVKEIGGEAMGFGDVKLMVLLGVMLGWPKLVAAFGVAIFLGAAIGSLQLILRRGHGTPFGPYLAFGAISAAIGMPLFIGMYEWYMQLLESLAT